MTEHFSFKEMYASATARRRGYDNTPPPEAVAKLELLCRDVLEPIRKRYGAPIIVGSGYRCPGLNKVIGGVATSQHMTGAAADIHSLSDTLADNMLLYRLIRQMASNEEILCRQIIWEYGVKDIGPDWIHIAINDSKHDWRLNQIVYIPQRMRP